MSLTWCGGDTAAGDVLRLSGRRAASPPYTVFRGGMGPVPPGEGWQTKGRRRVEEKFVVGVDRSRSSGLEPVSYAAEIHARWLRVHSVLFQRLVVGASEVAADSLSCCRRSVLQMVFIASYMDTGPGSAGGIF